MKRRKGELNGKLVEEKCHFEYTFPETLFRDLSKISFPGLLQIVHEHNLICGPLNKHTIKITFQDSENCDSRFSSF